MEDILNKISNYKILDGKRDGDICMIKIKNEDEKLFINTINNLMINVNVGETFVIKCHYDKYIYQDEVNVLHELDVLKINNNYFINNFKYSEKYFIMLKYYEGINLYNFVNDLTLKIDDSSPCYMKEMYLIMLKISKEIKILHDNDYVHLDIKSENIIYNKEKKIKLIDYEYSSNINYSKKNSRGTRYYVSPELLLYQHRKNLKIKQTFKYKEILKPSDMFSLGVTFYTLLTNFYPYSTNFRKNKNNILNFLIKNNNEYIYDGHVIVNIVNVKHAILRDLINNLINQDYKKRLNIDQVVTILFEFNKYY